MISHQFQQIWTPVCSKFFTNIKEKKVVSTNGIILYIFDEVADFSQLPYLYDA